MKTTFKVMDVIKVYIGVVLYERIEYNRIPIIVGTMQAVGIYRQGKKSNDIEVLKCVNFLVL